MRSDRWPVVWEEDGALYVLAVATVDVPMDVVLSVVVELLGC